MHSLIRGARGVRGEQEGNGALEVLPSARFVEQVVQTHIINTWESQDEPEHLRTIRDRLLRDEKLATRLLGLYQQILQQGEIEADDREGQIELRLSGLVVKQGSVLKVYNPIYATVFNSTWVERTLNNLRPYAEAFKGWIISGGQDESRLLRGQALEEALQWSAGRSLSDRDAQFLRASQAIENRETKQANEILARANHKAKRRLRIGSVFLGAALLAAGVIGLWGSGSINYAKTITQLERDSTNALEQFEFQQNEALLLAMRSAHQLKRLSDGEVEWVKWETGGVRLRLWTRFGNGAKVKYPTTSPILALQTILNNTRQQQLSDSKGGLTMVQFSPKGDRIINFGRTETTVLDSQGNQLVTLKHQEIIWEPQLSPDGKHIITFGTDGIARLWNFQGKQLAVFPLHRALKAAQFSPDGKHIITLELNGSAQLWDLQGNRLAVFKEYRDGGVTVAQFSPDGKHIVTTSAEGGIVRLWNLQGKPLAPSKGHQSSVTAAQFSPDSQRIVTGGLDGTIRLWDLQGKQLSVFKGYEGGVEAVQFSPDGKRIATGGKDDPQKGDNVIRLWDLQGNQLAVFKTSLGVRAIQFSPDGQRITGYDSNRAYLWHLQGNQLATFLGHQRKVSSVQFSPKGDAIAELGADGIVRLWNLKGNQLATLKYPQGKIGLVRFSPKGDRILTAEENSNLRVWDNIQVWNLAGRQLAVLKGEWGLNWKNPISPDGKHTVTRGKGNTIQIWDLEGNQVVISPQILGSIYALQFSPKGDSIATAGGHGMVRLWNLQGKELVAFKAHPSWVHDIYFTPDGDRIMAIKPDGARLWNLRGNQLASLEELDKRAVFSLNGKRFVRLSGNVASVWDWQGNKLATLQGREGWFETILEFYPNAVQLSSDGDSEAGRDSVLRIATQGKDGTVRVWDSEGQQIAEYEGYAMALSPDGRQIVVVSKNDNIPRMWRVDDLDGLLKRGCDWLRVSIALGTSKEDRQMCGIIKD